MTINNHNHIIRVAILADEPIGWGSGKHYFPIILNDYIWQIKNKSYKFTTKYIFDKDIVHGKLNTKNFDVLLVPGGGVGDGESIMKGLIFLPRVRKWKNNISKFIKDGGGYVGICGGAALITDLKTENKKPHTILERLYNKSSIGVSCVSSYYNSLAFPIFYPFQKNHPEKIGAIAYVFSFAPGETVKGDSIITGGIPLDFQILKNHPIFSDLKNDNERIRWWGGPALILPEKPDRDVKILAKYPAQDFTENESIRINAWKYIGGIHGLFLGLIRAFRFIKKENERLCNLFTYAFYFAGNWRRSDKSIRLYFSNKPCITAEIYPNENKGRILLCGAHPEYMIWWGGHIEEVDDGDFNCIAKGFHQWKKIDNLSEKTRDELSYNWWIVRRIVAWAAKVPDNHLPPIEKGVINDKDLENLLKRIYWDGRLISQMKEI